jgi:hypothetical protein
VILAYWAYGGGKPSNMTAFNQMWDTIVAKYGGNANAYFEVINEPYGYGAADLDNMPGQHVRLLAGQVPGRATQQGHPRRRRRGHERRRGRQ